MQTKQASATLLISLMSIGITNPPGAIVPDILPWPHRQAVYTANFSWTAPSYTGGLSSWTYLVSYRTVNRVPDFRTPTSMLVYLDDFRYAVRLTTYNSTVGSLSDATITSFDVDNTCEYEGETVGVWSDNWQLPASGPLSIRIHCYYPSSQRSVQLPHAQL